MKNNEAMRKDLAEKMKKAYPYADERTSMVSEKGFAACGVIAIFYVLIRIIYVGINGDLALPELVLLFIMVFAINRVNHQNKVFPLPNIMGKALDPAPSARGKRLALYALNALPLAISWTVIDMLTDVTGQSGGFRQLIIDFISMFTVAFVFDSIVYEKSVRKYNAHLAELEAEENDLSDD